MTVKLRLLTSIAGPGRDEVGQPGDDWEAEEADAERMIERGLAERIETTAVAPAENAMKPRAKPRAKKE